MPRFAISPAPIDGVAEAARMTNAAAGAYVSFEGWVRDHNEGQSVASLGYEAFEALAIGEGNSILTEAIERFGLHDAACVHRTGNLAIGDMAVWVGVTSSHRGAAFEACQFVIDEIKTRLPIWKREVYTDGRIEWVNCQACAVHGHKHPHEPGHAPPGEAEHYDRQRRLPEVGLDGQERLKQARVLVVGVGGLGAAAAQALAGAGIGHIGLCDFDRLEASNLNRQFLYAHADIGQKKTRLAEARLRAANPFVRIAAHDMRVAEDNAVALIQSYDLVLDCTDNFRTKFILNDACLAAGRILVAASVHRFEGQLLIVRPNDPAGCLRCLWPETPCLSCTGGSSCEDAGIIGAIPAMIGTMQALETIKAVLGLESGASENLIVWDGLSQQTTHLKRRRDPACLECGSQAVERRLPEPALADAGS